MLPRQRWLLLCGPNLHTSTVCRRLGGAQCALLVDKVRRSRALAHVHVLLSIHQPRRFNGEAYVSIQSSSIPQQPNEFTKIFSNYTA